MTGLRINVADLLHHPGARRSLRLEVGVAGLENAASRVDATEPLTIDVVLERVSDGIVVHGTAQGFVHAPCSRCLRPTEHELVLGIRELFEADPLEGETYPIQHEELDLEMPVRDAVMLELPAAPLCRADCLGLCPVCGVDRNEVRCSCATTEPDPRWAVLQQLDL